MLIKWIPGHIVSSVMRMTLSWKCQQPDRLGKNQWRLSWNPWNLVWVPWPFITLPGKYCSHVKKISHKITHGFVVIVVFVVFVVVVIAGCSWLPGGWINIKMMFYQYRNSHCKDKSVSWLYVWKEGHYSYIERATGKNCCPNVSEVTMTEGNDICAKEVFILVPHNQGTWLNMINQEMCLAWAFVRGPGGDPEVLECLLCV